MDRADPAALCCDRPCDTYADASRKGEVPLLHFLLVRIEGASHSTGKGRLHRFCVGKIGKGKVDEPSFAKDRERCDPIAS